MMAQDKRLLPDDFDEGGESTHSEGYDSELEVQKGSRPSKRQRVDIDASKSDDESDDESSRASDGEDGDDHDTKPGRLSELHPPAPATGEDQGGEDAEDHEGKSRPKKRATELSYDPTKSRNLVTTAAQVKKSGVLYISRIPPFMKPHKLRSLLAPYGAINRTYMAVEDAASRSRRVKTGGNKKKLFTEGWVEFVNKRDAKRACELLNARTIGGKKGTYYRDDIWSMLYLKGFKWQDLMSQLHKENQERASRMQTELEKSKRENEQFVRNMELGKEIAGIRATRERKGQKPTGTFPASEDAAPEAQEKPGTPGLASRRRGDTEMFKTARTALGAIL
jgi:ESF2/ABP1 family protein